MSNRSPLEALLDVMIYTPVGAAVTVSEELPKLAEKGRSTLNERLGMARVVGQFAVTQGRREVERRLQARRAAPPPGAPGDVGDRQPDVPAEAMTPPAPRSTGPDSDVRLLAIPGYDSLSAPQVVQRLAGLSPEEREAVRTYEASHRARQTILARVAQLHDQQ